MKTNRWNHTLAHFQYNIDSIFFWSRRWGKKIVLISRNMSRSRGYLLATTKRSEKRNLKFKFFREPPREEIQSIIDIVLVFKSSCERERDENGCVIHNTFGHRSFSSRSSCGFSPSKWSINLDFVKWMIVARLTTFIIFFDFFFKTKLNTIIWD